LLVGISFYSPHQEVLVMTLPATVDSYKINQLVA